MIEPARMRVTFCHRPFGAHFGLARNGERKVEGIEVRGSEEKLAGCVHGEAGL
jgi:hypothetical protein